MGDVVKPPALASPSKEAAPRILCVDDDDAIRSVVMRIMTRHGYLPVAAATFDDALRQVDEHDFAVAILDISLPTGDGISLLKRIKAQTPRTEAVMLSAHGTI